MLKDCLTSPNIGPLEVSDAIRALEGPVKAEGASFAEGAAREIVRLTKGYPYFLQEWGYQAWNRACDSPISLKDIESATADNFAAIGPEFLPGSLRPTDSERTDVSPRYDRVG